MNKPTQNFIYSKLYLTYHDEKLENEFFKHYHGQYFYRITLFNIFAIASWTVMLILDRNILRYENTLYHITFWIKLGIIPFLILAVLSLLSSRKITLFSNLCCIWCCLNYSITTTVIHSLYFAIEVQSGVTPSIPYSALIIYLASISLLDYNANL